MTHSTYPTANCGASQLVTTQMPRSGVLGIPFDNTVSFRAGAAFAPAKIRERDYGVGHLHASDHYRVYVTGQLAIHT